MLISRRVKSIAILCAATVLTACAGSNSPISSTGSFEGARVASGFQRTVAYANSSQSTRVFLSDDFANVYEYDADGTLSGTLTGFSTPLGLFVDGNSNLWVANDGSYAVMSFPKPYTSPGTTLHDIAGHPADIAVDHSSGVIAVATSGPTAGGYPSVSFYRSGTRHPCRTIVGTKFGYISSAAFDRNGTLYIVGANANNASLLGVVKGACAATKISVLHANATLRYPAAVRVSSTNDILFLNQTSPPEIDAYAVPAGNDLGEPVARTILSNPGRSTFYAFALSEDGKAIWIAAFGTRSFYEFAFPEGGSPTHTFATDVIFATGIAVDPPNLP